MLTMFLITFAMFAMAAVGIGIGVLIKGKCLKGSCGGVAADGRDLGDCLCELKKQQKCEKRRAQMLQMAGTASSSES